MRSRYGLPVSPEFGSFPTGIRSEPSSSPFIADRGIERRRVHRDAITCAQRHVDLAKGLRAVELSTLAVERGRDQTIVAGYAEAFRVAAQAQREETVPWPARPQAVELHAHAR